MLLLVMGVQTKETKLGICSGNADSYSRFTSGKKLERILLESTQNMVTCICL
jgi:hypothetical protein